MKKGNIEKRSKNGYRFTYKFNNIIYRQSTNAKDAEEAKRKFDVWVKEVERDEVIYSEYTVSEFAQVWIDRQVRPNSSGTRTPNKYLTFLENWFLPKYGNKYINKITREEMTYYFNWLKTQKTKFSNRKENNILSYYTVKKYKAILHAMFQTALEWKKTSENPCNIKIKYYSTTPGKDSTRVNYYRYKEYLNVLDILEKEKTLY